jgi:pimeloyl-ACP methyl ester carboxylesterase
VATHARTAYESGKEQVNVIPRIALSAACTLLLAACSIPRKPEIPMESRFYQAGKTQSEDLVVFLPGRGDTPTAFEKAGFLEILAASSRPMDAVVVDAHLGYYISGLLAERVYQDVLLHYRNRGYRDFYLVGTSLGGYGALWVDHEHQALISGLILIAPYLGDHSVVKQVDEAGGIARWRTELDHEPSKDEFPWVWLDNVRAAGNGSIESVILGFGVKDKFRPAAEIAAKAIPAPFVFRVDGAHNWKTWTEAWRTILGSPAWSSFFGPGQPGDGDD